MKALSHCVLRFGGSEWVTWVALAVFLILLLPAFASADGATTDWRRSLSCPNEHQIYKGLLYCTYEPLQDEKTYPFHVAVLVADLSDPDLRIEYLLPNGLHAVANSSTPTPMPTPSECRDPNIPYWGGPAGGCYDPKSCANLQNCTDPKNCGESQNCPAKTAKYPVVTLSEAVKLAQKRVENKTFDVTVPLAAIINADYAASPDDRGHGPEGLLVVRGQRLDRPDLCDDDFNAALRPSLSLGKTVNPATGLIPAQIARLEKGSGPLMDKTYTGVGGGPWLVEDGKVNKNADECESGDTGKWLSTPEPVTGCTGGGKADKEKAAPASKIERYGSSCYSTWHSAAGLSGDGRWLFLVMNDKQGTDPEQLAGFMLERLGVRNALKFDGGGSAHLWFQGKGQAIALDPKHEGTDGRALSSYLAVFASQGYGIRLPLQATTPERVFTKVRTDDESVEFKLKFTNTGSYTWMPDDNIGILGPGAISFVGDPTKRNLAFKITKPVQPGQAVEYTWKELASGLAFARFQMAQDGEPFGQDVQVIVLTVPQSMKGQAEKLQRELDRIVAEAKAKGEEGLNNIVAEVQKWFVKQGQNLLNQLAGEVEKRMKGLVDSLCGAAVLPLLPLLGFVLWRRRLRP